MELSENIGVFMTGNQIMKLSAVATLSLLCGCTTIQVERKDPVPSVFVDFNSGSADFNNKYELSEALNKKLYEMESKPKLVFVASGDDKKDFDLATKRLYSLKRALDTDIDYRVLVKPIMREEQRSRMAVYIVSNWNEFNKSYMTGSDYSSINGANGLFRSSDKRLYLVSPMKRKYSPIGNTVLEQLGDLLLYVGWGLEYIDALNISSDKTIKDVEFVTLEKIASSNEIELLVDDLISFAIPGLGFLINEEERVVQVFEKNKFGEEE